MIRLPNRCKLRLIDLLPLIVVSWVSSSVQALGQSAAVAYVPPAQAQQDWSGTWTMDIFAPGGDIYAQGGKSMPLAPKYRKIYDHYGKLSIFSAEFNTSPQSYCSNRGVPGELEDPDVRLEFVLTRGRVTMIVESGLIRRIWTDGRAFPNHVDEQSPAGYSIGHWEDAGRTLVVETRDIAMARLFFMSPISVTQQTRVVERFSLKGARKFELQVTVTDPEVFTHPYSYMRTFKKVPGTFPVGDCALYNRDNDFHSVDLTPPADVTSERQF